MAVPVEVCICVTSGTSANIFSPGRKSCAANRPLPFPSTLCANTVLKPGKPNASVVVVPVSAVVVPVPVPAPVVAKSLMGVSLFFAGLVRLWLVRSVIVIVIVCRVEVEVEAMTGSCSCRGGVKNRRWILQVYIFENLRAETLALDFDSMQYPESSIHTRIQTHIHTHTHSVTHKHPHTQDLQPHVGPPVDTQLQYQNNKHPTPNQYPTPNTNSK